MDQTAPARPRPDARGAGKHYWSAAREGRLDLPLCSGCGKLHWYPRVHCPHCGSPDLAWVAASGKGTIHTFTVVRQSGDPYFKTKLPYVLAMIDLDEGVRMMSNIVDCEPASVRVGAPVRLVFEEAGQACEVPLFRLAEERS